MIVDNNEQSKVSKEIERPLLGVELISLGRTKENLKRKFDLALYEPGRIFLEQDKKG
jgi:hypothetical protein